MINNVKQREYIRWCVLGKKLEEGKLGVLKYIFVICEERKFGLI